MAPPDRIVVPLDVLHLLVEGFEVAGDGQMDPFTNEQREQVAAFLSSIGYVQATGR